MATDDDGFETHHAKYLEKQREKVREKLPEEYAERLLNFIYNRHDLKNESDNKHIAASTARNYLRELRYLFGYAVEEDEDPKEWNANKWDKVINTIARRREIGDGTRRNTCYAARAYCRWSDDSVVEDTDEIDAPSVNHTAIKDEDVLDAKEVGELINSAISERNKAILGLMYEAAMRRTALIQLDVRHYRTDDGWNRIYIPDREGVKTAGGNIIPVTFSAGYVDRWLSAHPDGDNPDAPLFCSIRPQDEGKRLSSHSVYTMMNRVAQNTDEVDEEKVHPHILRHTRATQMRKKAKFDKGDIETVLDWASETPMHKRYEHADNKEEALTVAKAQGQDVEDEGDNRIQCPRCGSENLPSSDYCSSCTLDLSDSVTEWFSYYRDIAVDDDLVYQKYEGVPSAVPPLSELTKQELDHITDKFMKADALTFEETAGDEYDEYVEEWDVEQISAEYGQEIWMELINQLEDIYVQSYAEHPTLYRMAEEADGDSNALGATADELEEMAKERELM